MVKLSLLHALENQANLAVVRNIRFFDVTLSWNLLKLSLLSALENQTHLVIRNVWFFNVTLV